MKKTKKAIIFIFAVILAVVMSIPTSAEIFSSSKVKATIDVELQSLLKNASSTEKIPVDIWLHETSTVEERERKIFSKIGLNKAQIVADAKGALSSKQVDEYIATERAVYVEERAQQYAGIQLEYSNVQALQTTRKTDTRLFYSQYAPMISAELTSAEIKMMAQDSRVESICYSPNVMLKDASDISFPAIGANYIRDTLGYTGSGVRIGMIESGLPMSYVSNNICYDETLGEDAIYKEHANMVASILVGKNTTLGDVTYEGIVPDAELYATCASDNHIWYERVEWLLSQSVHVINVSAGFEVDGYYTDMERWVEYIISHHNVHFVIAAGNTPEFIQSPGLAYNAITVGFIDDNNSTTEGDDVLSDLSSYGEYYLSGQTCPPTNKPDLVAPGASIDTAVGTDSGSSFAAPHVTAVVAQLCQRFPSLRTLQAGVKAMLTASVSHSVHAYTPSDEAYDQYGAGVVNARAAMETANAYRMMVGSFSDNTPANAERTYTFTVPASQRVRVSLTWQKYAAISSDTSHENYDPLDYALSDLDLYVIHPEGADIEYSTEIYNNTEIVDFVAPVAGTYQMVVTNRLVTEQVVNYGISWWFGEIVDSD